MENKTSNVKLDQTKKSYSRLRTVFIVTTSVLGVTSVTFASLFIWKLLSKNNPVVPPTDVEYIENYTKEREYRYLSGDRYLFSETNLEYNKDWQVSKKPLLVSILTGLPLQ